MGELGVRAVRAKIRLTGKNQKCCIGIPSRQLSVCHDIRQYQVIRIKKGRDRMMISGFFDTSALFSNLVRWFDSALHCGSIAL